MIKCVVFDFDGVLENTYEQHFGLSSQQFMDLTREEHRKLFEGNIHVSRALMKARDTGFNVSQHMTALHRKLVTVPRTRQMLTRLHEHFILGIITSGREAGIKEYLKFNKLAPLMTFMFGYETSPSKIEKFKMAMEKFRLAASEILFVTDTLGDILEANAVGVKSIGVEFGYHERDRLLLGKPLCTIASVEELEDCILNYAQTKLSAKKRTTSS